MAVITSIAVATAASVAASSMKAKADQKAAQNANNANLSQYQQSRGAGGNAILPMYADPGTEKRLFDEAVAASDAMGGSMTPQEIYAKYSEALRTMQPTIDAGNDVVASIYDGSRVADTLAFQQPVLDARTAAALANRDAINLAVQQEANRLAAEEARKGYSGAGSFANNRLLDAVVGAKQGAARVVSGAKLTNAEEVAGIKRGNQDLQVSALDVAPNRVGQLIRVQQAPAEGVAALQTTRQQPLTFFRLNPGQPPQVQPIPSTGAGQLVLQGVGQVAGAYGSYAAQGRAAQATAPAPSTYNQNNALYYQNQQKAYDWQGNPIPAPTTWG